MKNIGYLLAISLIIGSLQAQIVVPGYPAQPLYPKIPTLDIGIPSTLADVVTELQELQKNSLSLLTTIQVLEGLKGKPGANVRQLRTQGVEVLQELKNIANQASKYYDTYAKKLPTKSLMDITNQVKAAVIVKAIEKDLSDAQSIVK